MVADLTAIRAIWAIWVFSYHLALQIGVPREGTVGRLLSHGYLGVDGFFVLSGMVLSLAYPRVSLRDMPAFWARRLRRIYPVHAATLLILLLMVLAGAAFDIAPNDPGRFSPREFLLHAALLQGWGLSGRWAWNYPSWSVSTEWAGYLAFPLLIAAASAVPPRARTLLAVLILAILLPGVEAGAGVGLNLTFAGALPRFFPEFLAGALLASAPPMAGRLPPWLALAAIPLACAVRAPDAWVVLASALAMAALLARARTGRPAVLGRTLRRLGPPSYAFYMSFALAEIVLAAAFRRAGLTPPEAPVLYGLLLTGLTAALAAALHRWVERPWQSPRRGATQHLPVRPSEPQCASPNP